MPYRTGPEPGGTSQNRAAAGAAGKGLLQQVLAPVGGFVAGIAEGLGVGLGGGLVVEGQQVQVWSESQQSWENGKVVHKVFDREPVGLADLARYGSGPRGYRILVRYGNPSRDKWLDAAGVAKCVRLAPLKLDKAAAGKSLLAQAMGLGANPTNFELPPGAAEVQLNF